MDYDTSYVQDGYFNIIFKGKNRLIRSESDHNYKYNLSVPQY